MNQLPEVRTRTIAVSTGLVCLLCILVLIGWQFNIVVFRSASPTTPATTPLTAILLLLSSLVGISAGFFRTHTKSAIWKVTFNCTLIVGFVVTFQIIGSYLFDWTSPLDLIFFKEELTEQYSEFPGRPSPQTVFSLLLWFLAIGLSHPLLKISHVPSMVLTLSSMMIPWIAMIGYLSNTMAFYALQQNPETGMSLITAVSILLLGLVYFSLWPDHGILKILKTRLLGRGFFQLLIPFSLLAPIFLGLVITMAVDFGLLDQNQKFGITWGLFSFFIAGFTLWISGILFKINYRVRQSEVKFRGLMESAPDAMVIVNSDGKIHLINKQATVLFGYSSSDVIGKPVEVLIPTRFDKNHIHKRDNFMQSPKFRGMGEGMELYCKHKNGREIPVEISLSPLQTEEGLLISAAIRDVSKSKEARMEILKKNKLLSTAEQIAKMGHWTWVFDGNRITWSDNLYNIFEHRDETPLVFDTYASYLHPDDAAYVTKRIELFIEYKAFETFDHKILLKSGKVKSVQLSGEVTLDANGEVNGMLGTCIDVTEQKKAEEEMLQTQDELKTILDLTQNQNNRLQNFAHIVSHNLRNHSSNIGSLLDLLFTEHEEIKKIKPAKLLSDASTNLEETIAHLSEVAILNSSDISSKLHPVNLHETSKKIISLLTTKAEKCEVKIINKIPKDCEVLGFEAYVDSIIQNFLTNSIRYRSSKRKSFVRISISEKRGFIIMHVEDNGLGIDLGRHGDKLFGMYKTFHFNTDGRGIGLFITKNQIEAMGGSIEVESEEGKGTVFHVKFKK